MVAMGAKNRERRQSYYQSAAPSAPPLRSEGISGKFCEDSCERVFCAM